MSRCIRSLIAISLFILTVTALCMPVVAADYECPKCGTVFDASEERCPFCKGKKEVITMEEKQCNYVKKALTICLEAFTLTVAAVGAVIVGVVRYLPTEKERYIAIMYFITAGFFAIVAIIAFRIYLPIVFEHRDLLWH